MRLFVALEAPEGLRREMVNLQRRLRAYLPPEGGRVRWEREGQMHLTLAFLGEVTEARLPDLAAVMAEVARTHSSFEATTSGVDGFPSLARPRVLFLGLAPCHALEALAADLQEHLLAAGFHPDSRPFRPHLTLARLAGITRFNEEGREFPMVQSLPGGEMVLVHSHLPPISRHDILARWRLGV